ncbi:MAG: hypothetical protein KAT65_17340 [Methanophagales archaeon]|nr:hypothetical protein [Methanophagales archaeon]
MRSDRVAEVDAQITTEEGLEEQLRALDAVGTDEARRLQAVVKVIWEWRQRRAKGRKIRRVADLEADIRKKTEQMRADSEKLQGETSAYISEYYGYGAAGVEREQGIAGEIREEPERKEKGAGPKWIQKYRERIEKGTITAEDILEEENKIREKPVKLSTVTKAIRTMGYPITGLRKEKEVK